MTTICLIGGGSDSAAAAAHYSTFLASCREATPRIGCVSIDEGEGVAPVERFMSVMRDAGDCRPQPILVPVGGSLDPSSLDPIDALFVCGGLTPAYASAMSPVAPQIRDWLAEGDRPYAGFSAGAEIAAARAIVGGWQVDGLAVCSEECGEDLDELTVVDGLALVPFAVEVHCAQWGTLSRLVAAVECGAVPSGIALDEDTMLVVDGDTATVSGNGRAWVVTAHDAGTGLRTFRAGSSIPLPIAP